LKLKGNNVSAVGIIYREANPREILIEAKTGDHPWELVRGQLCVIGGNWIGENARGDKGPLDTFLREVREELSLDRPRGSSLELQKLHEMPLEDFRATPIKRTPAESDRALLEGLREGILAQAEPFLMALNSVDESAFVRADPQHTKGGTRGISCYYMMALNEDDWGILAKLQFDYGNLSNESVTLITSLDEILETGHHAAFAHDYVLRAFFMSRGFAEAENFPLVEGGRSIPLGMPCKTYEELTELFDIAKTPFNA